MIHVENLTKYYNDFCAVDRIGLDIKKGEILGLLGPNGAGKTTTMRMLTGFLTPTQGSIRVKDFNTEDNRLEIKRLLGYLPESAPLYHDMLVFDYLDYVADIRGIQKSAKISRLKKIADLCGLNEVMHKTIGELSKGYKQRVGLAHAMMNDPEILILDEPTSGLDPNQIVEIRDIIKKIGEEKTVILSTHILSEAEATCDRIVIINKGKIVADNTAENLKQKSGRNYWIDLALLNADMDSVRQKLGDIPGVASVSERPDHDEKDHDILNITVSCDSTHDIRGEVYQNIKGMEWVILDFHRETESLESIFRELTMES